MKRKRFSVEQIVGVLKQAEVGVPVAGLIRQVGIFHHLAADDVGGSGPLEPDVLPAVDRALGVHRVPGDLVTVGVLAGIITFAVIRLQHDPHREGRASRFYGSHTRAAWLVLAMIFLVVATLLIYRGAQINTGVFPYPHGAFASQIVGHWLAPLGYGTNAVLEATFILLQIAVVMVFLVIVVYSKHLHIFAAPLNVLFSRRPNALRGLEPMRSDGKVLDFEEADPDTDVFGLGKIEDFTWKGLLDMATCTESGGASRSARPGPPASRCRPNRSSWICATTPWLRPRTSR